MIDRKDYQEAYKLFRGLRSDDPRKQQDARSRMQALEPRMRELVERFLAGDEGDDPLIDAPVLGDRVRLREVLTTVSRDRGLVGQRISHYHLRRIIASGGMGTVYEAVQEKPRRTVAVKVMRRGLGRKSARRRFEYEAQVLARLRHPHVAQIIEAGIHEDGGTDEPIPYFVMEYIPNAQAITKYADEKGLGTSERLALFREVCDAVHHGHQKGIIHRDLKPANILIDSSGEPKIIDFGVARSTDSDLAVTTLQTDVGQLLGTLQYMSPEQCEADPHDLDTRSDIYTLGVVMYELLCGQLPYDVTNTPVHKAVSVVREATPVPPSTVNRTLRGDIETIALKALEKDRERRYQSALDLSQDITRYLNHETIMARPPSLAYQLRKFARRHRAAAAAVLGIAAALVLGIEGTTWQAVRATRAEGHAVKHATEARTQAATATAVVDLISKMLSSSDPHEVKGPDFTVRELLDDFAAGLEGQLQQQPVVEAAIRSVIGEAYLHLGLPDLAEPHLARALTLRLLDSDALNRGVLRSRQLLIRVVHDRGRYEKAEQMVRNILHEIGERDDLAIQRRVFVHDLADLLRHLGRYDEAEMLYRDVLEYREDMLGERHPWTLATMGALAQVLLDKGQYDEARMLCQQVLDNGRSELGVKHPVVLGTMSDLASVYKYQGRYGDAEDLYRRALEIKKGVLDGDHPDTLATMHNLADLYARQGRFDEAEPLFADVLQMQQRVLGEGHPHTVSTMNKLAKARIDTRRYDEAESVLLDALEIAEDTFGEVHPATLQTVFNLAVLYKCQRRYDDAEVQYRKVIEGAKRIIGEDHPNTLSAMSGLADLHSQQGRYADAERWYLKVYRLEEQTRGKTASETLTTMGRLANLYWTQGRYVDAAELYRTALEHRHRVLGEVDRETLGTMTNLGIVYADMAEYDKAEAVLAESLAIKRRVLGINDRWTRIAMEWLAKVYDDQGYVEKAEPLWREVLEHDVPEARADDASAGLLRSVAWQLLTCSVEDLRDPQLALEFAMRAVEMTDRSDPGALESLALALHQTGDAAAAVEAQQEALSLMSEVTAEGRAESEERLSEYEAALSESDAQSQSEPASASMAAAGPGV